MTESLQKRSKTAEEALSDLTRNLKSVDEVATFLGIHANTVRGWRHRCSFGVKIGKHVYFRPNEVEHMSKGTNSKARRVQIEKRGRIRKINRILVELWFRPELLSQAERQASAAGLALEDYFQLIVYGNAPGGWKRKLNPPMEFPR